MKPKAPLIFCLLLFGATVPVNAQTLKLPPIAEPLEQPAAPSEVPPTPVTEAAAPAPAPEATAAAAPSPIASPVPTTLPGRGMSMDHVSERFGSPREKVEQVGTPPITRWVYAGFTVYFEYDKVIHAVSHKQ